MRFSFFVVVFLVMPCASFPEEGPPSQSISAHHAEEAFFLLRERNFLRELKRDFKNLGPEAYAARGYEIALSETRDAIRRHIGICSTSLCFKGLCIIDLMTCSDLDKRDQANDVKFWKSLSLKHPYLLPLMNWVEVYQGTRDQLVLTLIDYYCAEIDSYLMDTTHTL